MRIERKNLRGVSLRGISLPRIDLRGGGDNPQDWAGYPLELDLPSARTLRNYTIFGNTDADAKGVGDEVVNLGGATYSRNGDGIHFEMNGNHFKMSGTATNSDFYWIVGLGTRIIGHNYLSYVRMEKGTTPIIDSNHTPIDTIVYTSNTSSRNTGFDYTLGETYDAEGEFVLIDLTDMFGAGNEPSTADEFAHRLGYADAEHLPAFPYGSSFVAPIRVGSRNLADTSKFTLGYYLDANGVPVASAGRWYSDYIRVKGGGNYTMSWIQGYHGNQPRVHFYRADKTWISGIIWSEVATVGEKCAYTFAVPADAVYIRMGQYQSTELQIEAGDTATAYEPYFATLYPSVLSSPLHKIGDIVDYKESNGNEWHGLAQVDLGSLDWQSSQAAGHTRFHADLNGVRAINYIPVIVSPTYHGSQKPINPVYEDGAMAYYNNRLYCFNSEYDGKTAAEFKEGMAGEMLVYALAEPTEVQGEPLPRLAIPKGTSIVTLDTEVEPSNITAKV